MSAESLLAAVREATNALRTYDCTPEEVADATADCRALEVVLAEWRHRQEATLDPTERVVPGRRVDPTAPIPPPAAVGQRWELVPTYKVERTWNTGAILSAFSTAHAESLTASLVRLLGNGALRVNWMISRLTPAARQAGIKLTEVEGPIIDDGDLDAPMIGVTRKLSGYQRVPLMEEDDNGR